MRGWMQSATKKTGDFKCSKWMQNWMQLFRSNITAMWNGFAANPGDSKSLFSPKWLSEIKNTSIKSTVPSLTKRITLPKTHRKRGFPLHTSGFQGPMFVFARKGISALYFPPNRWIGPDQVPFLVLKNLLRMNPTQFNHSDRIHPNPGWSLRSLYSCWTPPAFRTSSCCPVEFPSITPSAPNPSTVGPSNKSSRLKVGPPRRGYAKYWQRSPGRRCCP